MTEGASPPLVEAAPMDPAPLEIEASTTPPLPTDAEPAPEAPSAGNEPAPEPPEVDHAWLVAPLQPAVPLRHAPSGEVPII